MMTNYTHFRGRVFGRDLFLLKSFFKVIELDLKRLQHRLHAYLSKHTTQILPWFRRRPPARALRKYNVKFPRLHFLQPACLIGRAHLSFKLFAIKRRKMIIKVKIFIAVLLLVIQWSVSGRITWVLCFLTNRNGGVENLRHLLHNQKK